MTPPWRPLIDKALDKSRDQAVARVFQLSTVRPDGTPANRSVVFRGFFGKRSWPQILTDSRSSKMRDIQMSPAAELCWYFPETREQFRLHGELIVVGPDQTDAHLAEARRHLWSISTPAIREMFFWPEPGTPRESESERFLISGLGTAPVPSNFLLLLLRCRQVDHVDLGQQPHLRSIYSLDSSGDWNRRSVYP